MAVYNITNATKATNPLSLLQEVDILSEGIFGLMLFLTLIILIFMILRGKTDAENDILLAVTSWFALVLGLMLAAIDLLPLSVLLTTFIVAILSLGYLYAVKR